TARERVRTLALVATHAGGGLLKLLPPAAGLAHLVRANVGPMKWRLGGWRRLLFPESHLRTCDLASLDAGLARDFGPMPRPALRLSQIAAMARHDTRARLAALE